MSTKVKNIVQVALCALLIFGLSITCWFKPAETFSQSENKVLAQFPELNLETLANGQFMSGFESYTQDQFPLRDEFIGIKNFTSLNVLQQMDTNDIYHEDGYLAALVYPLSEKSLDRVSDHFAHLYKNIFSKGEGNVYLSVIPDKGYFLAEKNGYLSIDYQKMIDLLKEKNPDFKYIDITGLLSIDDYYFTDTHWRQDKIVDVAQKLASEMGVELSGDFKTNVLDKKFDGVYLRQLNLPLKGDTITYLTADHFDGCTVTRYNYDSKTNKIVPTVMGMYDDKKAESYDPYEMFLSGAQELITIDNPNATTDKELVIFRDSFGSSISPLLTEAYSRITIVDLRYIKSTSVAPICKMLGIELENADALFLYSTLILNNASFI